MNRPVLLLSCALALLACCSPASVNAATLEHYYGSYDVSDSACSSRNFDSSATAVSGIVSGTCYRDRFNDSGSAVNPLLGSMRLTCTVGGNATVEYFSNTDGTCTGASYRSILLSDKTCTRLSPWNGDVDYVDCAASTLPSSIAASPNVIATQYFSDFTCQTAETDVAGLAAYASHPVANTCTAPVDKDDDETRYDISGGSLYHGTYRQSSPAGIVSIAAVDSKCTQWASLHFQPLDACTMTTLGKIYAHTGTSKTSYVRYTSGAAAITPPVAWPMAVGSNVQQLQCLDNTCTKNCVLTGLQRTGLCVPSAPKSSGYNSYMNSLSADGLFGMVSLYSDDNCAQRTSVIAQPLSLSLATCYNDGMFNYAAAPSGLADAALVQLPLPPLAHAHYLNYSVAPNLGLNPACVSSTLFTVSFMQTDTCVAQLFSENQWKYAYANGNVSYTTYKDACARKGEVGRSYQMDTCHRDAPNSHSGESFAYAYRSSDASRASQFGTLAGWYSADPNDLDASQAYGTALNNISAASARKQSAPAAIAAATAAALVLVLAMGF